MHTGTKSLSIRKTALDGTGYAYQDIPATAGMTYRASTWTKTTCTQTPCNAVLTITCLDSNHQPGPPCERTETNASTLTWTNMETMITTTSTTSYLRINLTNTPTLPGYGTTLFDDVVAVLACEGASCSCNDNNPCTLDEFIPGQGCTYISYQQPGDNNCDGITSNQELQNAITNWLTNEITLHKFATSIATWKTGHGS
jgi:hypothetical protein